MDRFASARDHMVEYQLRSRDIDDERVLSALAKVPRHVFVPAASQDQSYYDGPLPIGQGQTISQPYIVAYMTQHLQLHGAEHVLEIGTGSGYQTAILAELAAQVYTIEIKAELSVRAQRALGDQLGYSNIHFHIGAGQNGWPEALQFDRMIVTACPEKFPQNLFGQLRDNGIVITPEGSHSQMLVSYHKIGPTIIRHEMIGVSFVPLL